MAVDISAVTGFNSVVSLINALDPVSRVRSARSLDSVVALASTQTTISNLGFLLNASESLDTAAGKLAAPGAFTAPDADPARQVGAFVDAFNAVQAGLAGLARNDPAQGLSVFFLRSQLAAALGDDIASIGIRAGANGSLVFDGEAFQAALTADPQRVERIFSDDGRGVAEQVALLTDGPLSPANLLQTASPAFISPADLGLTLQASLSSALLQPLASADFNGLARLPDQFLLAQLQLSAIGTGTPAGSQGDDFLLALLAARSLRLPQSLNGVL